MKLDPDMPYAAVKSRPVTYQVEFAAVVTPPDVVSQLALAIPMCILYEVGIWAAQLAERGKKTEEHQDPSSA